PVARTEVVHTGLLGTRAVTPECEGFVRRISRTRASYAERPRGITPRPLLGAQSRGSVSGAARWGAVRPRWDHAADVATRPRGVRARNPIRTRKGSASSSTVSRSSATATASVDTPTGPPPKFRH